MNKRPRIVLLRRRHGKFVNRKCEKCGKIEPMPPYASVCSSCQSSIVKDDIRLI